MSKNAQLEIQNAKNKQISLYNCLGSENFVLIKSTFFPLIHWGLF